MVALLRLAKDKGVSRVFVHAFTDGRDTSPTSGLGFVADLEAAMAEIGVGRIATVSGRSTGRPWTSGAAPAAWNPHIRGADLVSPAST